MTTIIDNDTLYKNIQLLSTLGIIYYPLKTNSSSKLLETLINMGISRFLVSNTNHIKYLDKYNEVLISYINTISEEDKLLEAYNNGVKSFVFDDYNKLNSFLNKVGSYNNIEISIKISVSQLNTDLIINTGAIKSEQIKIERLLDSLNIRYGYSIYINKQAKKHSTISEYINSIDINKRAKFISIGGIGDIRNESYYNELISLKNKTSLEFRIEPGEYLVDKAINAQFEIISVHDDINYTSITIDGSIYNEFFDLALLNRQFRYKNIITNNEKTQLHKRYKRGLKEVHIFGNSSDSCDYLGKVYVKSESTINTSSILEVFNIGAYFSH